MMPTSLAPPETAPPSGMDPDRVLFTIMVLDPMGHEMLPELEDYLDGAELLGPSHVTLRTQRVHVYWLVTTE